MEKKAASYAAGEPDSATGYSHYNQHEILGKDDSLFVEHYMCLQIVTASGTPVYVNPDPQSDTFCRVRRMSWTEETDKLIREMYEEFMKEVEEYNADYPVIEASYPKLRLTVKPIYSLIDGKFANAIVGNKDTHKSVICIGGSDFNIGPSFFHCRLNSVQWITRMSAKKNVSGKRLLPDLEVKA